ncbi:MAG: outer membrane beta-barrel family protein [Flavobacterium sp.]
MKIYLFLKIILLVLLFCFSMNGYSQVEIQNDSISNKLNEVIIKTDKKAFTNQNGNIKLDVANSVYNSIPNTMDLLSRLPSVQISSDREKITVAGKGSPLIYIDNQKVSINDLNALTVADIKTIEIIQNPSSKYEAEGRSVILITRKFSKKDSFRTEISEIASFKKDFNNYLGFNSSFKKNKLEWKVNFNYNKLQPWEGHSIYYQIPEADIVSNYNVAASTKRNQFIYGGGLFYKINEEDYLSVNISSSLNNDSFDINTVTYNKNQNVENNVYTWTDNTFKKNFINSFLNYSKKIKSIEAEIFTGFQYSNFDQGMLTKVANNYNNTQFELAQDRNQDFNVGVFSGRIDIEKKFKNEIKLEIGGLYSAAKSKSDFNIFYYDSNENTSSHYDFKEENSAAYSQLSGKIKKIDFSVGLRVENTNVNGQFKTEMTPLIDKNYTNFFPKAQLTFPIDSVKSISLNYAKSIQRPNYSSLSQRSTYINPYFLYARNINLQPTFTNEISTAFQYHDKSVKLTYYQNKNPAYNNFQFDSQQNILTFIEANFEKESGFNIDFELPFSYKLWTTTNSLIFVKNKIEDDSALFQSSKPYLYYYSSQEFKFPKQYTFGLIFSGTTIQKEGVYERNATFIMNMTLSKIFKNWNCTLSYNDIFKKSIYKEDFTINNINSRARYLTDANEISISIKYSFGKIKNTEFKEKDINENSGRIK